MNALKHGMTAKTVLLPEEDPAEFQQKMVGWFHSIKPQDQCEASLVENAVYSLWQLERANRSAAARLWSKADSFAEDEENRVDQEVAALVRRLLRPHTDDRWCFRVLQERTMIRPAIANRPRRSMTPITPRT